MSTHLSPRVLAMGTWALAAVGSALCGAALAHTSPGRGTLLVAAIAISLAVPVVVRARRRGFDPFEPIVVFAIAYGTMFVVRPAAMIAGHQYTFAFRPDLDIRGTFDEMLLLALLGAMAFATGYLLPWGRQLAPKLPRPPLAYHRRRAAAIALVGIALGLATFAAFVAQIGGPSRLGLALGGRTNELLDLIYATPKYLAYGSLLMIGPAVVLFALSRGRRTPALTLLATVAIVLAVIVRGSFGSRVALLPLLGAIVVYWYLQRERRPRVTTLVAAAVVALIVSAAIGYGRDTAPGQSVTASYLEGLRTAVSTPAAALEPILEAPDASMAPNLAAAMTVIPERTGYRYGVSELTDLFARPIPRQFWPAKPLRKNGQITLLVAPRPGVNRPLAIAYSVLLNGYLDWGLFGALWLIGYGVLGRAALEWLHLHHGSTCARVVFALALPLIVPAVRDGPVDTLFLVATMLVPTWLAFRLARRVGADEGRPAHSH